MRKALIVGVDYYESKNIGDLRGCVNDAHAVKNMLEKHADGTINFAAPRLLTATGASDKITKNQLKDSVKELVKDDPEIALLYFAGHGYIEDTGGFLCTSDCERGDDGLALTDIMALANLSKAKNKVIILDSCHSGTAGDKPVGQITEIKEGITILTASTADQYAMEASKGKPGGVFTTLLVDGLGGGAANLLGQVTPGSVYAYIDLSLGPWGQRPVFKTNVKTFVTLRNATPPISLQDIQQLTTVFPRADYDFQLDPSYEPHRSKEEASDPGILPPDADNNVVFALLQRYVKVNLVRPVNATHMYHAAMNSKSCELTVLGQHYHNLVGQKLI